MNTLIALFTGLKLRWLLVILITPIVINAQVEISGKVITKDGNPIPFANLQYKASAITPASKFTISSQDGSFRLMIPATKQGAILEISCVGFIARHISLLESSNFQNLIYTLTEDSTGLPSVIITASPSIEINKDTISFLADAFKTGQERNIGELLSGIPGFNVSEKGRISFNGEPINKILFENDDLTGKKYELFIKNLSTNGIEKVQLYQNYIDKENIQSTFIQSQKAVNFKFKKGFLQKPFGNMDGAIGLPKTKYDLNSQELLLSKKTKIIAIQSLNSTGDLKSIDSDASTTDEQPNNAGFTSVPISKLEPLFSENDLNSHNPATRFINKNNSSLWSLNLRTVPTKKMILKSNLKYISDNFSKQLHTENTYFITPPVTIERLQETNTGNIFFEGSASINFIPNPKDQIVSIFTNGNRSGNYQSFDTISSAPIILNHKGSGKYNAGQIVFNHLIDSSKTLNLTAMLQAGITSGNLYLSPSTFDTFFFHPNPFLSLQQSEIQNINHASINFEFSLKKTNRLFKATTYFNSSTTQLYNGIYGLIPPTEKRQVIADSTNNFSYRIRKTGIQFSETIFFRKKSYFTSAVNFSEFDLRKTNNNASIQKTSWLLMPSVNIVVQLSDNSKISASASLENKNPELGNISDGYIIGSLTQLRRGTDSLANGKSKNISFSFSHIDFQEKHLFLFTSFLYQKSPLLYISNQVPGLQYSATQYFLTDKSMEFATIIFHADKFLHYNTIKISPYGSYVKGSTFGMLNLKLSKNRFTNLKLGLDLSVSLAKKLKILLGGSYTSNLQAASTSPISNSMRNIQINTKFYYKFSDRIFLNCGLTSEILKVGNMPMVSKTPLDFRLTYQSKNEKFSFGIDLRNLLNQDKFTSSFFSPFTTTTTSYELLPRIAMATFSYKF